MKLYLVCLLLLCGSQADDEVVEDIASLLSDDFLQKIEKRLSRDGPPDATLSPSTLGMVSDPGSGCFYQVTESKIIRTHDSINNGAVYIDSGTEIQNKTGCRSECCKRSDCDLAVFKDKGEEHACYLFACSGQCLFTNHTGFSTMEKHRKAQQHEEDLENLATDPPPTTTTTTTTTTTATTTTTSTTTPAPTQPKQPAPLYSTCAHSEDCGGTGTDCVSGFCVCKQGFHPQEGVCREECSRFQFECANEGKPGAYPQCIAVYDQCDGITHCQDGSDELQCKQQDESIDELARLLEEVLGDTDRHKGSNAKATGPGSVNSGEIRRPLARPDIDRPLPHTAPSVGLSEHDQRPVDQRPVDRQPSDRQPTDRRPTDQRPTNQRPTDQRPLGQRPGNTAPSNPLPPTAIPVEVTTKTPTTTMTPSPTTTAPTSTARPATSTSGSVPNKRKPAISGGVVANHVGSVLNDAASERHPSSASNRTAVVVLALGLAVTALLLIFVGCRLRMVKRRLRRGRPLNSNEADYLINGMYL